MDAGGDEEQHSGGEREQTTTNPNFSNMEEDDAMEARKMLEDGWEWKRYSMIGTQYKVNIHDRLLVLSDIRNVLMSFGEEVFDRLLDSCVGHLFSLPNNVDRCNKAVHYVISREIVRIDGSGDDTEMWFRVGKKYLRFSRYEYALVSGLRFGGSEFEPDAEHHIRSSYLYSRKFNKKKIQLVELLRKFKEKGLGGDVEDYLKVAKILVVNAVLLGMESKHTIVEWVWALVEDDEAWESFPWGSYSYQRLLHFLKKITTTHNPASDDRTSQYHIYGFSLVFIGWIYCAIPVLGEMCGVIADDRKKSLPRMLRFEYKWSNLDIDIIRGKMRPKLKPKGRQEKNMSYWLSIESGPFLIKHTHRGPSNRRQTHRGPIREPRGNEGGDYVHYSPPPFTAQSFGPSTSTGPVEQAVMWNAAQSHAFLEEIKKVAEEAARLQAEQTRSWITDCISRQSHHESTSEHTCRDDGWGWTPNERWGWNPDQGVDNLAHESQCHDHGESGGWTPIAEHGEKGGESTWGIPRHHVPVKDPVYRPRRDITPIQYIEDSCPTKLDWKEVVNRVASIPLRSPFRPNDIRGADWIHFRRTSARRNVGLPYAVDKDFFEDLCKETTQLNEAYMDAYLAIIHSCPAFAEVRVRDTSVAVTTSAFYAAIVEVYKKTHSLDEALDQNVEHYISPEDLFGLSQYVSGEMPGWGPLKPWYYYNKIAIVANIPRHWVALCAHLDKCEVSLFDSSFHNWSEGTFANRYTMLRPLCRILPQLLKYCGFWDARPELNAKYTEWVLQVPDAKIQLKQFDGTNCGLYALKSVENIFRSKVVDLEDPVVLMKFRRHIGSVILLFSTDERTLAVV